MKIQKLNESLIDELNSLPSERGISKVNYDLVKSYKEILNKFPVGTVLKHSIDAGDETFTKTDGGEYGWWDHYRAPWKDIKHITELDMAQWLAGRAVISTSNITQMKGDNMRINKIDESLNEGSKGKGSGFVRYGDYIIIYSKEKDGWFVKNIKTNEFVHGKFSTEPEAEEYAKSLTESKTITEDSHIEDELAQFKQDLDTCRDLNGIEVLISNISDESCKTAVKKAYSKTNKNPKNLPELKKALFKAFKQVVDNEYDFHEGYSIDEDTADWKYYIGDKQVPYTSYEDAKAHMKDDYNILDYKEELQKYIDSQKANFTVFETYDDRLVISINWGDWKHEHAYADYLVRKFFREKGLEIDIEQETTEEDGSDTYSAEHYYEISDIILNGKMIMDESLDEPTYVGSSIDSLNNFAKGLGDACKNLKDGDSCTFKGYDVELNDGEYNVYLVESKESKESIEVETIGDYITDHYDFDDIDDKYSCINSIRDSFKDEKTISKEELEQFIGSHNGKDKVEEDFGFKSGNPYLGRLPAEPSSLEYGKALNQAYLNSDEFKKEKQNVIDFANACKLDGSVCKDYNEFAEVLADDGIVATSTLWNIYLDALNESEVINKNPKLTEGINDLRNEKGQVMADKWYARMYPDDEVGIEQLNGITLDDALKDRSILGHCDTQVRERVYAQLDKYIPLSKESPMYREVNEDYSDLKKGEWVEYNLSVKKGVKHIIPVKVEEDLGKEFYGWAWSEGYHRYDKSRIVGKIDMNDTDEIIRKYSLNEASYGGAYDISDDQFFTRDDIENAAEYVLDHINETFEDKFILGGTWFEGGRWTVNVQTADGMEEYEKTLAIDMRKVRAPRDLKDKFNLQMAAELIKTIKEEKYNIIESIDDIEYVSDNFELEEIDNTFIEGGEEFEWIDKRMSSHESRNSNGFNEEWFIASAKSLENNETYYFIIDENDFIDWGPCNTYDEAFEFIISKQSDYIEDDDDIELFESIIEDAEPINVGPEVGMASVINELIKDEYEAIDAYNAAIATAQAEGFEDAVKILTELQAEENIHVGQLQEVMKLFDPNADKVEDGQAEGVEQLSNPTIDEVEDLD